ncbi:hypothetical protein [Secundilactobacillus muriivasis]
MNNKTNIFWAQLILDNQATIEDVPAQLRDGVSEVVAYFTKTAQSAESQPATEPAPTTSASTATTVATAGQSDADQAIDDANKAVDDATK